MIACRVRIPLCASLALLCLTAAAQRERTPALGNVPLARRRSSRFLAERGLTASPNRRYSRSPAQLLGDARAQFQTQSMLSPSSTAQVPAWQPIGPAQVVTSAYGPVAGRVTSLAADSSDATGNTVYVGTAFGGVWKSTNAAGNSASVTLSPLTDSFYSTLSSSSAVPSLSIGAISVQPVTPGVSPVILAGTGIPNDTTASYFGSGILRSADGGSHWTLVTQSSDRNNGANVNFSFTGNGFAGFAWGVVSGNPVVVAAVSQAAQSVEVNAGQAPFSILGIYYSLDQGQTWYMATIADPGGIVQSPETSFGPCSGSGARLPCGNAVTSIVWNPARKQFYAAVRFHGYYSSADGQNWMRLPNQPAANLTSSLCPYDTGYSGSQACPIYNGALAVQPVTGDTFALTTDVNNLDQGLWQDSCQLASGSCASPTLSFTQIPDAALEAGSLNPSQPTMIPQADYDLYLAAVPMQQGSTSDTLLFAGTADIFRCDLGSGCAWRNTTHAQASDCNSAHVAPAQYAIDATFGASGLLYFGNDGGLWRSSDGVDQTQPQCSLDDAAHFQNLNPGFTGSIAEVEDIAPELSAPQNIMVSLGPLGTAAPIGGTAAWQQALDGEGDYAAIDPANSQNWYATSEFGIGINYCDQGSSCGVVAFGSPIITSADVGDDGYGQIIPAPWILDPQNSSNIILGTCRIWRGPASGGIQNPLSGMLDGDNGPYCDGNAEIRSLAASGQPSDPSGTPERIYAGMAGLFDGGATVAGHVFEQSVTTGSTPSSWIDLSHNLNNFNPSGFDISSIYIDPHSSGGQTVYVTLQGFGTVQVYQSLDAGSIWQNISSNLTKAPANSVVVDPSDANTVYVATDAGVYYTKNVGSCAQPGSNCWSPFGTSLPNVPIVQLKAVTTSTGPALLAATYGRGVWQVNLPSLSTTTATISPASLTFANQMVGTTSAPQQLLVTNTGSVPLQVTSLTLAGDYIESDTCNGKSILPGDACIIEVSFAPTQTGSDAGLLTLYGNLAAGGQLTVPLNGTGTPGASVTLTPQSLCFAATLIGQTSNTSCQSGSTPQQVQSIVIANTGPITVALTSVSVSGDFILAANTCGASLAPANTANDSCTVSISFKPTLSGSRTGALTVVDSAGTQTAQLFGTGQTAATDVLSPLSLTFAAQTIGTTSSPQQITLANNGDQSLLDISVQSSSSAFIFANNCGTTLAGHSICAIAVNFVPGVIGTQSGSLTVSDTIASGTSATVDSQQVLVSGTGLAPVGVASASPASLDFGYYAVGKTSPPQLVAVTNNGSSAISAMQTSLTGDFSTQPASQSPCGTTLPAGSTCYIAIVFSPTQVNQRTGSITITGSYLPAPLVVALSGSGASFSMKVIGAASQIVTGAQTPQPFQLEIDPVNASVGPVALTCTVIPATAACSVAPASVMLTGGSTQSASVTFTSPQQARATVSRWNMTGLMLCLLLPIGFLGKRRRGWRALMICAFLALLFPAGCGVDSSAAGGASGSGSFPAAAQYTLTVAGSMPGITQTVTMQVNVQ